MPVVFAAPMQEESILAAGREVVDNDTGGLLEGIDDAFCKVITLPDDVDGADMWLAAIQLPVVNAKGFSTTQ